VGSTSKLEKKHRLCLHDCWLYLCEHLRSQCSKGKETYSTIQAHSQPKMVQTCERGRSFATMKIGGKGIVSFDIMNEDELFTRDEELWEFRLKLT